MTTNDSKPWFASKGILGSLFAAAGSAVVFINAVTPESADVPPEIVEQINDENTVIAFAAVGTFISAVVAWIGRLTAKKSIKPSIK